MQTRPITSAIGGVPASNFEILQDMCWSQFQHFLSLSLHLGMDLNLFNPIYLSYKVYQVLKDHIIYELKKHKSRDLVPLY